MSVMNKGDKLSLPTGKRLWYWVSVMLAIFVVFICIDHWFDMTLTVWHSNDFLDCLFNGKITHFYEHCWNVANEGGYCGGGFERDAASYSPVVYFFLGILILPIYILDKCLGTSSIMLMESWVRLLMVIATFLTGKVLAKSFSKYSSSNKSKDILLYVVSSPIFFLSVLILDQYDIVGALLVLLAFNFYLEDKMYKFAGVIAVAMGFKFFPLIMFFPLLFMKEKKIGRIALLSAIAVAPYALMMFIVKMVDPGYSVISSTVQSFVGKMGAGDTSAASPSVQISLVIVLYCAICAIAYLVKLEDKHAYFYWGARVAFVAYLMFFMLIDDAHEQWFTYLIPFMTLVFFTMKLTDEFMLMETGFAVVFYIYNATNRGMVEYVRVSIMAISSGKEIDYTTVNLNFYNRFFSDLSIPVSLLVGFAVAMVIVVAWDAYQNRKDIRSAIDSEKTINYPLWFMRLATLLIYVVPLLYMYNQIPG
ncbi:MAG: hypothetical protein MJ108_03400 [Saccharofermentans sp.]|nr:hypothetical protein [Saccharofermentans sp.]